MRTTLLLLGAALVSGALWATPTVEDVQLDVSDHKRVKIAFRLTEPAVVTIDIQTNEVTSGVWRSIGAANFTNLVPNVAGRRLAKGAYEIVWKARSNWPDQHAKALRAEVTAWALDNPPDLMAVDLTASSNVVFYASESAMPFAVTSDVYKTDWLLLRRVRAAGIPWRMGSSALLPYREDNEVPRIVTLTEDFYLGVHECTQGQRDNAMNVSASGQGGRMMPYVLGSYHDLRGTDFSWPQDGHQVSRASLLGRMREKTGVSFDLPTSAQWEFAARGGEVACFVDGSEENFQNVTNRGAAVPALGDYANALMTPSLPQPDLKEVGSLKPSGFGFYDLFGNVWEWCLDWCPTKADVSTGPEIDPVGPLANDENFRVCRGGSIYSAYGGLSLAHQEGFVATRQATDTGFRVACPAVVK